MKLLFFLITLKSFALPILDETAASNTFMTIYPDHKDRDLFYVVPKTLEIAIDRETKKPLFSYQESKEHCKWPKISCRPKAVIKVLLKPKYDKIQLSHIRPKLLNRSAAPVIVGAPYSYSYMQLEHTFNEINAEKSFCEHKAGQAGTFQACVLHLTEKGVELNRKTLKEAMNFVVHLEFKVKGLVHGENFKLMPYELDLGVSGTVGSSVLRYHPDLFKNSTGEVI